MEFLQKRKLDMFLRKLGNSEKTESHFSMVFFYKLGFVYKINGDCQVTLCLGDRPRILTFKQIFILFINCCHWIQIIIVIE